MATATVSGEAPASSTGARVINASATLVAANLAARVVGLLNVVVLARILDTADYGIIALALITLEMAKTFSELQVGNALVRISALDEVHYRTAFTISLIRGVVLAGLIYLSAPAIAAFFGSQELHDVLLLVAILPLIDGIASPRLIDYTRSLQFRWEAYIDIFGRMVTLTVAIGLALLGFHYWALIIGMLVGTAISVAITYRVAPWRPAVGLGAWREILGFGSWMTLAGAVAYINGKLGGLIIGRALGAGTLGIYTVGDQLATLATIQLARPFSKAIYAGMASLDRTSERVTRAYLRAQGAVLGVVMPAGIGFALVAHHLVIVTAGEKWLGAVIVIQILAPIISLSMITAGVHALVMTMGRTHYIFYCELVNFLFRLPVLITGVYLFGLIGVLFGRVITGSFHIMSYIYLVHRVTGGPIHASILNSWRSIVACAAMAISVLAYGATLPEPGTAFVPNALALITKAVIGGTVYSLSHLALWMLAGRPDGFERIALEMGRRVADDLRRRLPGRASRHQIGGTGHEHG